MECEKCGVPFYDDGNGNCINCNFVEEQLEEKQIKIDKLTKQGYNNAIIADLIGGLLVGLPLATNMEIPLWVRVLIVLPIAFSIHAIYYALQILRHNKITFLKIMIMSGLAIFASITAIILIV